MKRKSTARLQSELWNRLRPEIDSATLITDITNLLHKLLGQSKRNVNVAHNLATYLMGKYAVSPRKKGELNSLIAFHANDLKEFLAASSIQGLLSFLKTGGQLPKPKKKLRSKPKTAIERAQRQRRSKNRYESRRRHYRDALIEKEFGTQLSNPFNQYSFVPSTGPCLDILFSGGGVRMAGCVDSLENLFGIDRHRFPKSLPHKRNGRNKIYGLPALTECLIHLLAKSDVREQWPAKPGQRPLIVVGIIERARRFSPELAETMMEKLRSYVP